MQAFQCGGPALRSPIRQSEIVVNESLPVPFQSDQLHQRIQLLPIAPQLMGEPLAVEEFERQCASQFDLSGFDLSVDDAVAVEHRERGLQSAIMFVADVQSLAQPIETER